MPNLLLPLAVALAVGGSAAGASVYLVTRGETVEEVAPSSAVQASPTPEPTQPPSGVGGGAATVVTSPTPTATPPPAAETPAVPADWLTYVDPVLGFTLDYPPDLAFTDLTGPIPAGGLRERTLEFRSPEDRSRAFAISIVESNPRGLTIEEWALEFAACQAKSIQPGTLGGIPAILCTREVIEGRPGPAVLAEHDGRIFLISGPLTDSEFARIAESFQF